MTDLLTRIRAYVAAIPTHNCIACGHKQVFNSDVCGKTCPRCGRDTFMPREDTKADALLREVAALEPVATVRGDTGLTVTADRLKHYQGLRVPRGSDLYTLTGATHAPE